MNGNNVRQPACQMSFCHAVLALAIAVEGAGVVEKMNAGKGVSGRWRLV